MQAEMTDSAANRLSPGFRALTVVILTLSAVVFAYGLLHKSAQPVLLGRFSLAYGALLAGVGLVVVLLGWVLWRQPARLVRWLGNAYAFLVSSVLVLGAAEIGLRVVNPWGIELFHTLPYHMQGMVDHPQLGYVHPRSVSYSLGSARVALNSHGLRDEEIPYAKPPDERRILALGDSVTFGWGVSQGETFSDRMEPLLRAATAENWQVINAGVNGYNTEQEATFLRIEGMRYRPDIVLLLYVANDIDPIIDPNVTTWRRFPTWPSGLPQLLEQVRGSSYLYQVTNLFARMREIRSDSARASGSGAKDLSASITSRPGWPASLAALRDIADQCARANVRLLVARESGDDPAWVAALQQAHIEAISLAPAWTQIPVEQHRVSRLDPHPSAVVHAKFAEHLTEALRVRGWLEP